MFILRSVTLSDLDDLYTLSGKVTFINLPHDRDIIEQKVTSSLKSFKSPSDDLSKNYFIFVLEDTTTNKVIGVSMIHAQHGTEEEPHFYLEVDQEHKFSKSINTGFVHGTLKLGYETNGPTEIGGLVVDPDYRGNPEKLGKQISFIRFLYMAMYPQRFKQTIHSELMPPLDSDGNSPLWESIGRKFMNMDYNQADVLSRNNKEFILSLFPTENIYMTLLPPEARNAVGEVGDETKPVKKMLESIGFHYTNQVDPFDGGPHYQALMGEVSLIKNKMKGKLSGALKNEAFQELIVSFTHKDHPFFAIKTSALFDPTLGTFKLTQHIIDKYNLDEKSDIEAIHFN